MYTKILVSTDKSQDQIRAFVLASHHRRSTVIPREKDTYSERSESQFGTKSYKDALQRAFNRAKLQIFFNPDMKFFVTLTYAGVETNYDKVMHDIKMLVKAEKRNNNNLKYIYVLEWQKRGSLHVHMITNNQLTTYKNKNNYQSLQYWSHGFTSMLSIKDFDNNFKPYLYLFKYMRKAERIGKTFVHSSRNLNNYKDISHKGISLQDYTVITQERTFTKLRTGQQKNLNFYKYYLKHDMLEERRQFFEDIRDYNRWQTVLLNSTKVKAKKQVNHLLH